MDCSWQISCFPSNSNDLYAVAVFKDNVIFGHLPRQLSWILPLFILINAPINIYCVITQRRYSKDQPQEGLKNTCKLLFGGKHTEK